MTAEEGGSATATTSTGSSRRGRVTLADVAKRAGVSRAAASFALTGRKDQRISEQTQIRVRQAADELGYRPSAIPKILRSGNSGTIALVSEFVASTPYATRSLTGALEAARENSKLLFIAETLGDPVVGERMLHDLIDRRVDGFIYASMFTQRVTVPEALRDMPLVLLNCVTEDDPRVPMVVPDEVSAGATAARAIVDAGHRAGIYYLGDAPPDFRGGSEWGGRIGSAVYDRVKGVRDELSRADIKLSGAVVLQEWEPSNGRDAVEAMLQRGEVPRALICANDRVAFGAFQALKAAGRSIPEDVSVISFDDSDLASWVQPGLSSIALPHEAMGRAAVELLMNPRAKKGTHLVPMELQSRGSIASPVRGSSQTHLSVTPQ